jgi:hypothetical protein
MNNWLTYFYNLRDIEIYPYKEDYIIFKNDESIYLLKKYNEDFMNINNTLTIFQKINRVSNYYVLILNNYHQYISKKEEDNYVLMSTKGILKDQLGITSIYKNNRQNRVNNTSNINWDVLWSKRIDYMEYQIAELGKNKKETLDSFSFFSGLAENAISFIQVNNIALKNVKASLCHNRIIYPNLSIEYYNPLNVKIDYEVRDAAEYIKAKFLAKQDVNKDINYIINKCDYNDDDLKMFYARLMFPTTYFDVIENIILSDKNENIIDKYVDSVDDYIYLLKDAYLEISKKVNIIIPEWLKKTN